MVVYQVKKVEKDKFGRRKGILQFTYHFLIKLLIQESNFGIIYISIVGKTSPKSGHRSDISNFAYVRVERIWTCVYRNIISRFCEIAFMKGFVHVIPEFVG